jgi:hypothetical protein
MYYIAMAGATLKAVSQGDAMVLAQNPNQQDVDDAELPAMPPCDLYSDEPPLESYLHLQQLLLLIKCLDWLWQDRDDYFAAGNLTIYYSSQKIKTRDFKGPDFFVVLGTEQRLNVLVNNAGVYVDGWSPEALATSMAANASGPLRLAAELAPFRVNQDLVQSGPAGRF